MPTNDRHAYIPADLATTTPPTRVVTPNVRPSTGVVAVCDDDGVIALEHIRQLDLATTITALVFVCVGVAFVLFGYRLMRLVLFTTGLLIGAVIIYVICAKESLFASRWANAGVALGGGGMRTVLSVIHRHPARVDHDAGRLRRPVPHRLRVRHRFWMPIRHRHRRERLGAHNLVDNRLSIRRRTRRRLADATMGALCTDRAHQLYWRCRHSGCRRRDYTANVPHILRVEHSQYETPTDFVRMLVPMAVGGRVAHRVPVRRDRADEGDRRPRQPGSKKRTEWWQQSQPLAIPTITNSQRQPPFANEVADK